MIQQRGLMKLSQIAHEGLHHDHDHDHQKADKAEKAETKPTKKSKAKK
jgi:hypothetical protein